MKQEISLFCGGARWENGFGMGFPDLNPSYCYSCVANYSITFRLVLI